MKYYLAPLEGITGHIYRNAVHDLFGTGIAKYFTPFFGPNTHRSSRCREIRDVLPENNPGVYLVPQILTDDAEDFLEFEEDVSRLGYEEVNINIGCPSGTVTSKGRGAGMLRRPEAIRRMLEQVFEKTNLRVSVKTRVGDTGTEEFAEALEIYDSFPLEELIVHPRLRTDQYRPGTLHMECFAQALRLSPHALCYNGDVNTPEDWERVRRMFSVPADASEKDPRGIARPEGTGGRPGVTALMCGRGMAADPSLIRQLDGGPMASARELRAFFGRLAEEYLEAYGGSEHYVLHRLKEIWAFMGPRFPEKAKNVKRVMKARSLEEYRAAEGAVLED